MNTLLLENEIKINTDGIGFCSIKGLAQLTNKSHKQLYYDLMCENSLENSALVKFLIEEGFKEDEINLWYSTGIPDRAIVRILEYWTYKIENNSNKEDLLPMRVFTLIGLRIWMKELKGFPIRHLTGRDLVKSIFV